MKQMELSTIQVVLEEESLQPKCFWRYFWWCHFYDVVWWRD